MARPYSLCRFRCPKCGQRLAVEAGQVHRGETVVCQDCNTDLQLHLQGTAPAPAAGDPRAAPAIVVELRA